jgi:hypothetical protein
VLVGLPQGVGGRANNSFYFILAYFHNTQQVLVRLPKGDGGLVILFYLFYLFYLRISFWFI